MYNWEIIKYLEERNYKLETDEIMFMQDHKEHPQINHIKFENDKFYMWADDGTEFCFGYHPPKVKTKRR